MPFGVRFSVYFALISSLNNNTSFFMFPFALKSLSSLILAFQNSFVLSNSSKPINPKSSEHFIPRTDAEAEAPVFWPPDAKKPDSLEKTLMLGKLEGNRRRGWQR